MITVSKNNSRRSTATRNSDTKQSCVSKWNLGKLFLQFHWTIFDTWSSSVEISKLIKSLLRVEAWICTFLEWWKRYLGWNTYGWNTIYFKLLGIVCGKLSILLNAMKFFLIARILVIIIKNISADHSVNSGDNRSLKRGKRLHCFQLCFNGL